MIVHDVVQRSEAWHALRCGRLCGSRAHDALKTIKSGAWSAQRANLRIELVLERLTGKPNTRNYVSQAMQDGIDREDDARSEYQVLTGNLVEPIGFVTHDSVEAGFSPDGEIDGFEGLVEIKAPQQATHYEYLRTGQIPDEYAFQIQHGLWITGAKWCDWLSFHPDFPRDKRVRLVRVARVEPVIAKYEQSVRTFLAEVDTELAALDTMTSPLETLKKAVGA